VDVLFDQIPEELIALDRWVVWAYEERDGKRTKPPYQPVPGKKRHALVNVASTWGSFARAKETLLGGEFDGIGFVLGDGIFGIDFDHASPEMVEEALALGSYTEWSPSGQGVHVIGRSEIVLKGRKKGSIELYMQGRYFTVTGARLDRSPAGLRDIPADEITAFFRQHFGDAGTPGSPATKKSERDF
jgi:putative DNA primase/helicase